MLLCDYGCGFESTTQLKNGKNCCSKSSNSCPINKKKNSAGGKRAYKNGRISGTYLYQSLDQPTKDRMNVNKGDFSRTAFIYNGTGDHKRALLQERGHRCEECKNTTWQNEPIPLELEHVDGDNKNNVKENLKLLCCNCHALTPTWRGRNKNTGSKKVSDAELLTALQECSNIRAALQRVGLAAKGGNYKRAKKICESGGTVYTSDLKSDA